MRSIPSGADRQHGATVPAIPADALASGSQSTIPASDSESTVMAENSGSQTCDGRLNALTASESAVLPGGAKSNPDDDAHREGEGASVSSYNIGHIMVGLAQNS